MYKVNVCFLFVPYSGKPEMSKERDVGETAETTRRPPRNHQTRGTTGVGAPRSGSKRQISPTRGPTESVAFDQWIRIFGGKLRLLRVAQSDSRFARWQRRRSRPGIGGCLQKLVGSTSYQIHSDATPQYQICRRIEGIFGGGSCSGIRLTDTVSMVFFIDLFTVRII